MVTLADSLISSSSRRLPVRMRPDLSVRYHRYQGRPYWVIKEPIGLKYYRFQEEEYSILRMLDGECSFDDIKQKFEHDYAPQKISLHDLQHFIGMLHRSGLLVTDAEGQGMQLRRRRDETVRRELLSKFSNILAIRFKGIDPDRLLNWLSPWTNWFFTKWAGVAFGLLGLIALLLVGVKFEEFRLRLPAFHEFFGPQNWFWLGITLALTKVMHEFGHGLSCKKFGGECHEIGVMILVLTPCLYCNVSDSWLLPNKWHRAVIGAAGMYVEVVLASIATFLWWFSEPGLLNHICLSIMFICSVSTVLFNGNPLLRFDGYYILSDIAEIPNLRQKSSKILQRYMSEWCLGIEQQEDPFLPQRNRWFFAVYTIAAVIYRWIVVLSIFLFLNKVLEPYGLKVLGQIVAFAGLVSLVVQPAWQFGKFLHVPGRMHQVKKKNVLITAGVLVVLLGAFLYLPFPYSIKAPVEVQPRDAVTVYASVPGMLTEMQARAGQQVKKGDVLARLTNDDLRLRVLELEQAVNQYREQIDVLEHARARGDNSETWASLPELYELLASAKKQLNKELEDLAKLQVSAQTDGTIIPAKIRKAPPSPDGQLPQWKGSLLDPENQGAFLQANDELFRIGDPSQFEVLLAVDQADINSVHLGQAIRIKLHAYAGEVFETTIDREEDISRKPMRISPESMAVPAGGALPTQTDPSGAARPLSATYQVKAPLPEGLREFKSGQRGWAKISAQPKSLGQRVWRYITRTFHFEL